MEALNAAHGGQALDLEIIDAAPGSGSKVYGNDARFADVHFLSEDAGSTLTAVAHFPGVTTDAAGANQAAANSSTKLVLGSKAGSTDDQYNGGTLRVYYTAEDSTARPSLANAKPLHGGNSPHGPVGFSDHLITDYTGATKLAVVGTALPCGTPDATKAKVISYEILPGIKATGSAAAHAGKVLVLSGRLHVPQL